MPVTRPEKKWILIFAAAVAVITTIPYCVASARSGSGYVFTGFLFGLEDGNSYIAKMLSGAGGAWLFRSPYTAYPQNGILAFFPYLLLGKLAAPPAEHEQLVALFQIFRLAALSLDIYATYFFIARFIRRPGLRKLGTFFAVLGGGLGWLLVLAGQSNWLGSLPLEFYSPETFGFLEIYSLPHLAAARGLLFLSLGLYVDLIAAWQGLPDRRRLRGSALIGLLLLLTGLFQPLTALIGWIVICSHLLAMILRRIHEKQRTPLNFLWERRALAPVFAISAPIILYTGIASLTDPYMQAWTTQNIILSPHPLQYLVAFGALLPFAVAGGLAYLRQDFEKGALLAAWMALLPFLAYFPYNLQRRLPEGIWVVLITAALALVEIRKSGWVRVSRYVLVLGLPSTVLFFMGSLTSIQQPATPVYRPREEIQAFTALANTGKSDPVVLAAYDTGNALPAWAPVRVLIGHGPESIHLKNLQPEVDAFFDSNTPDRNRLLLIHQFGVKYVFWGPLERKLGDWDPYTSPFLKLVYQKGEYSFFAVTDKEGGS